ncbi:MAG: hypothetical protein AB7G24_00835 [Novosphingobium sp.]
MTDKRVTGTLGDLAAVPGMPSEPTLRKLIKENPDFPVISTGSNGRAYEIDVAEAVAWLQAREEKIRAAERARSEEVRQFALDLLGSDSAAAESDAGLSAAEQKQLLEAELAGIKVAERRGELIRRNSVEEALAALLVMFRQRGETFSARLAKRIDLTREQIAAIDELMRQDQNFLADRMEKISEPDHADAATGADPAV